MNWVALRPAPWKRLKFAAWMNCLTLNQASRNLVTSVLRTFLFMRPLCSSDGEKRFVVAKDRGHEAVVRAHAQLVAKAVH